MARQDIFVCMNDDKISKEKCSSSARGIVKTVSTHINTDVAGQGSCDYTFQKNKKNVRIDCSVPRGWKVKVKKR